MRAVLQAQINKTDRNDARGMAQMMRAGLYRPVHVKTLRSQKLRMLLICREVQVNLAYRWFCKLGIEDTVPDNSAFSRTRNERFREGDVFRRVIERVVETCIASGLVGGDLHRTRGSSGGDGCCGALPCLRRQQLLDRKRSVRRRRHGAGLTNRGLHLNLESRGVVTHPFDANSGRWQQGAETAASSP
jgi:hypothetical protein